MGVGVKVRVRVRVRVMVRFIIVVRVRVGVIVKVRVTVRAMVKVRVRVQFRVRGIRAIARYSASIDDRSREGVQWRGGLSFRWKVGRRSLNSRPVTRRILSLSGDTLCILGLD